MADNIEDFIMDDYYAEVAAQRDAELETDLIAQHHTAINQALAIAKKAEDAIPSKYWIEMDSNSLPGFEELFLGVRLKLRDDVGAYDAQMLNVLRKLRCAKDGSRSECVEQKE